MASDSFNVGNMNGSLDPSNRFCSNQTISDRDTLDISPPLSRSHQPDLDFGDSEKKTARGDAEWESNIKAKQKRLLLLFHSLKCQYEDGTCPVTRFCSSMKKLWKHMADCKDNQCKVQHCVSSRYVLRHHRHCKYVHCSACRPVREKIRKIHETEKLRQVYKTFSI
jgi:E1A/CREB-binding protein